MNVTIRWWRWTLPALAALAWCTWASAQQPLSSVELAPPIAAPPAAAPAAPAQPAVAEPAATGAATETGTAPAETADAPPAARVAELDAQDAPAPVEGEEPAPLPTESSSVVELIKERYPGGAVKVEREMTLDKDGNYVLQGAWRNFDEQGRLIIDGRNEN